MSAKNLKIFFESFVLVLSDQLRGESENNFQLDMMNSTIHCESE